MFVLLLMATSDYNKDGGIHSREQRGGTFSRVPLRYYVHKCFGPEEETHVMFCIHVHWFLRVFVEQGDNSDILSIAL